MQPEEKKGKREEREKGKGEGKKEKREGNVLMIDAIPDEHPLDLFPLSPSLSLFPSLASFR
jgi:hypothetical protein